MTLGHATDLLVAAAAVFCPAYDGTVPFSYSMSKTRWDFDVVTCLLFSGRLYVVFFSLWKKVGSILKIRHIKQTNKQTNTHTQIHRQQHFSHEFPTKITLL